MDKLQVVLKFLGASGCLLILCWMNYRDQLPSATLVLILMQLLTALGVLHVSNQSGGSQQSPNA